MMSNTLDFLSEPISHEDFIIKEHDLRNYIVDASVVFKWYYKKDEGDLEKAESLFKLLETDEAIFIAPGLLIYEILNVIGSKNNLYASYAESIIEEIFDTVLLVEMDKDLAKKAYGYAASFGVSFYDSSYLALSSRLKAPLITADKEFFLKASRGYDDIVLLRDYF
jgi:predicted nucleic acid-binding protein